MSSSSDIEKLFDHFGGDASAYQEIGRENEARTARTRWPLLVTLDLTQPAIPPIGQRRATSSQAMSSPAPQPDPDYPDTTPKDASSVTRAKSRLFTQPHRRDIPPVVVAAPRPSAPTGGASRFGSLEAMSDAATPTSAHVNATPAAAVAAPPAPAAPAPVSPAMPAPAAAASAPASASATFEPIAPVASISPAPGYRSPVASNLVSGQAPAQAQVPAPAWMPTPAPVRAYGTPSAQPVQPAQPASILGKLFAQQPHPQPASQPAPAAATATASNEAPLQSVFDRLRGTAGQPATAPAAAPVSTHSWLVNGPRRS
ncbi:MAG TPA: cellulose biosynthesis protein BcsP [Paraburkholderia sp.]|nr:cellulose biosynthesis protein BcsP [Paraburkholderia sp.]